MAMSLCLLSDVKCPDLIGFPFFSTCSFPVGNVNSRLNGFLSKQIWETGTLHTSNHVRKQQCRMLPLSLPLVHQEEQEAFVVNSVVPN